MLFEKNFFFLVFTTSRFPYVILCPNFMMVQTSKVKVPHTYKKLIRRFVTFEYEKVLLSKSSQNNVASNITITWKKEKQVRHIITATGHFERKLMILQLTQ